MRRIVYIHTAGPYPGLRQILGVVDAHGLFYLHTGEMRSLDPGPLPDRLAPVIMWPDGRMAKGMRLKSTEKYAMYLETPVDELEEAI